VANSTGLFTLPETSEENLARIGLSLFGYGERFIKSQLALKPAMGLKARISHIHEVDTGEGVSYGHQYRVSRPSRIATLPLGYADGIPRGLSNQMSILIQGQENVIRVPQVGRITMDQMMVDVTEVSSVTVGQTVTLLGQIAGERITLSDWAAVLKTIEYELMCGLRVRLPRTYQRSEM
jgi:alanine racemase